MSILHSTPKEDERQFIEGGITICVVGLGRIGLPTAAVFANAGGKVLGVDINPEVVASVNAGSSKFTDEPGLNEMLAEAVSNGKLSATTDTKAAVGQSDMILVCVPTPIDMAKSPDYSFIKEAAKTIGRSIKRGSIVVVESTVGPGTVETVVKTALESESGLKGGVEFGIHGYPVSTGVGRSLRKMT